MTLLHLHLHPPTVLGLVRLQVPARVCRKGAGVQWLVDFAASTDTHWKLAPGAKALLGDWLVASYDEATQGWVAKRQRGEFVLVCTLNPVD